MRPGVHERGASSVQPNHSEVCTVYDLRDDNKCTTCIVHSQRVWECEEFRHFGIVLCRNVRIYSSRTRVAWKAAQFSTRGAHTMRPHSAYNTEFIGVHCWLWFHSCKSRHTHAYTHGAVVVVVVVDIELRRFVECWIHLRCCSSVACSVVSVSQTIFISGGDAAFECIQSSHAARLTNERSGYDAQIHTNKTK